ncbi:MAG: protease inhibitor I42 family protein [bacterium]
MILKKNRYLWLVLVSIICLSAFPALRCSVAQKSLPGSPKALVIQEEKTIITFTKEDDGGEYRFQPGQVFQVILPENPTTGYRWTGAEPAPSCITLIRQEYTPSRHDPRLAGAGGVRTMTFRTVSKGSTYLVLLLRRPWDTEGEHVDSFNLNLHIEE